MAETEVTDERIYSDLKAYQDAGMLEYVLPTEPLGEQWIIGWQGQILKFVTKEGIVGFLTGIQAGALFAKSLRGRKHDPEALCDCRPGDLMGVACEYRLLADAVGEAFNPPDDDGGEVSLLITAVERIAAYVADLNCRCAPDDDGEPCGRCDALGQRRGEPVQR